MPGVFRYLQHWVPVNARPWQWGTFALYFALCLSPCIRPPEERNERRSRPICGDCIELGRIEIPTITGRTVPMTHTTETPRADRMYAMRAERAPGNRIAVHVPAVIA